MFYTFDLELIKNEGFATMNLYNALYGLVSFHILIRQWQWPKNKRTHFRDFAFRSILICEANTASEIPLG